VTVVASVPDGDPVAHERHMGGAAGRIMRGLAANIGGIGVTLAIQLLSVPVFLSVWGVPMYGEWLVLSAIPTYVALSDLSFSSVAANSMVMLQAAGKHAEAVSLGRRLWSIVTVMTAIAVIVAIAIAIVFGGASGSGAAIPASEAQIVLVALFVQVAIGTQYGVLDAWYRAGGRYPLGATLRHLGRLLEFGALMGAVLLGARPSTAAIAFLGGSAVGFLLSWIVLRRTVPWSTFRLERPHLQTFRELAAPGTAFMAFPIGNALSLQGFTIVIGVTLGATAVVVFSTTRTITRVALMAMSSIANAVSPELSRSIGSGHLDEARGILRRSVQVALLASLAVVLGLVLLGVPIIRWWTRGLVDPPLVLLVIFLFVIIANSTWYTLGSVLAATNKHRRMAGVFLLGTTAAVLVAVPLSTAFGLAGAATALLAIDMAMIAYVFPAALDLVQDGPRGFLRSLLDVRGAIHWAVSGVKAST
jgi:O-antigen/teichoic acid export membrane protein